MIPKLLQVLPVRLFEPDIEDGLAASDATIGGDEAGPVCLLFGVSPVEE
jgi:hypothetical protein